MWKVVSNQSQKTNAVASAKPMLVATQNHFLKVAPASMAAAIVITMENPMSPMKGLGIPKASACGVRITVPQLRRALMSQTEVCPASTKI